MVASLTEPNTKYFIEASVARIYDRTRLAQNAPRLLMSTPSTRNIASPAPARTRAPTAVKCEQVLTRLRTALRRE